MKTAILVDGGYYRKRAFSIAGDITAKERAEELYSYCKRHLWEKKNKKDFLNMNCIEFFIMIVLHHLKKCIIHS